ncbi:response regulator [candidate division FCPU426 bacterium]|nr:response regulator [candidate division FCPU426 bacterium]
MSKKILVVDDEPAISRLVKMSLAVDGYDVRTANSGFEAMEEIESWKPELVVLDIMMPGMNGYEVCFEVKSKPQTKGIKIVFLSARGNPGDAQQGLSLGADDYLMKPFDPDELLEKIRGIIGA